MVLLFLKLKSIIKRTNTAPVIVLHLPVRGICTSGGNVFSLFFSPFCCSAPFNLSTAIILVWMTFIHIDLSQHLLAFCTSTLHSHARFSFPSYRLSHIRPNVLILSTSQRPNHIQLQIFVNSQLDLVSTHRNFVKINCILVKSHSNWIKI